MDISTDLWRAIFLSAQENWVAILAAIISVASAIAASAQTRRQLRVNWNRDVMAWARDAMAAIASAHVEFQLHDNALDRRSKECLAMQKAISASVDQGRLFFENTKNKRAAILDPLVYILRLLETEGELFDQPVGQIVAIHRRNFLLRVQKAIDPAWMRATAQVPDTVPGTDRNPGGRFDMHARPDYDPE